MDRPWTPEQALLLPPSPMDWLPEGHLAYFVLDRVRELDVSGIEDAIQSKDGRGVHDACGRFPAILTADAGDRAPRLLPGAARGERLRSPRTGAVTAEADLTASLQLHGATASMIFAGSWGHPICSIMGPPARGT